MEGKTLQHAIIIITTIIITRSNIRLTHTQTGHQEEEEEAVPAEEGRTGGRGGVASTEDEKERGSEREGVRASAPELLFLAHLFREE